MDNGYKKKSKLKSLLKHPLLVAIVSALISGAGVAIYLDITNNFNFYGSSETQETETQEPTSLPDNNTPTPATTVTPSPTVEPTSTPPPAAPQTSPTANAPNEQAEIQYNYADDQYSGTQGENGWEYVVFNYNDENTPSTSELVYVTITTPEGKKEEVWNDIDDNEIVGEYNRYGRITKDGIHPGKNADVARVFIVPKTGTATIVAKGSMYLESTDDTAGVEITVYLEGQELYRKIISVGERISFEPLEVNVNQGEKIYFRINNGFPLTNGNNDNANYDYLHWVPGVAILP